MSMSRARALPPDIFTDERLIALPIEVKWTAVGLRARADDQGRGSANAGLVKADVWPLNRKITERVIEDHILAVDEAGYIALYADGPRSCYVLMDWPAVSHPIPSKFPAPPPELIQRRSSDPLEALSAGERRERDERGERAEGGARWNRSGAGPSPFCKLHPEGTEEDCRHCGTARLAQKEWEREQRARASGEAGS